MNNTIEEARKQIFGAEVLDKPYMNEIKYLFEVCVREMTLEE